MLNQYEFFLSQPKTQAVTLSLCLSFLLFAIPLLQRKAMSKLTDPQKKLYDPIAKDSLAQVLFLFCSVVVYSFVSLVRNDTSFISGDALPFVCTMGSISAFWNIRKAILVIRNANHGSNKQRRVRLEDIYGKSLKAYTAALIAFVYGFIVVLLVLLTPHELPNWLWFVSFLMTGPTIYALSWSISCLAVATMYEQNTKLGRSLHHKTQAIRN